MDTPKERVVAENYWIQVINSQKAFNDMLDELEEIKRTLSAPPYSGIVYEVTF
jgi:hypothetical protein